MRAAPSACPSMGRAAILAESVGPVGTPSGAQVGVDAWGGGVNGALDGDALEMGVEELAHAVRGEESEGPSVDMTANGGGPEDSGAGVMEQLEQKWAKNPRATLMGLHREDIIAESLGSRIKRAAAQVRGEGRMGGGGPWGRAMRAFCTHTRLAQSFARFTLSTPFEPTG